MSELRTRYGILTDESLSPSEAAWACLVYSLKDFESRDSFLVDAGVKGAIAAAKDLAYHLERGSFPRMSSIKESWNQFMEKEGAIS